MYTHAHTHTHRAGNRRIHIAQMLITFGVITNHCDQQIRNIFGSLQITLG